MNYLICFLIFFIYNFSIDLFFFPISSRYVFAIIGVYSFLKNIKRCRITNSNWKKWRVLIIANCALIIVALLSSFINNYFDPYFFKYPIVIILSLSAGYGMIVLISNILKRELTFKMLLQFFVASSLFQCLFSFFLFLTPSIKNIAFGLLKVSATYNASISYMLEGTGRVLSFGAGFFVAGIMFSLSIIFSAMLYNMEENKHYRFIYIVCAIIIAFIGSTISRTTLVGLLGFLLIIFHGQMSRLSSFIKSIVLLVIAAYVTVLYFSTNMEGKNEYGTIFDRAFSVFYIYQETGQLQDRYSMTGDPVYPDNTKSWIIGDGKMADPNQKVGELSYYKQVDIGICRLLLCIGIIGFLVYIIIQYSLCALCGFGKFETYIILLYFFIFMMKGMVSFDANLAAIIMFHLFANINKKRLQKERILYKR